MIKKSILSILIYIVVIISIIFVVTKVVNNNMSNPSFEVGEDVTKPSVENQTIDKKEEQQTEQNDVTEKSKGQTSTTKTKEQTNTQTQETKSTETTTTQSQTTTSETKPAETTTPQTQTTMPETKPAETTQSQTQTTTQPQTTTPQQQTTPTQSQTTTSETKPAETTTPQQQTTVEVTSVVIQNIRPTVFENESFQVTTVITPSNATNKSLTWKSSNTSVATVDSTGTVKAIKEGSAKITATSSNKVTASFTVTVIKPVININPETTIKLGETANIIATSNASNNFTYKSSDTKIATVSSSGVVTPKRTGTVTITISNSETSATTKINITGYRIHFIKMKTQSDCILLESNGEFGLVDTGRNTEFRESNTLRKYLDKYNITSLKFIILSHIHLDHSGGLIVWGKEGKALKNMVDKVYYKSYYYEDDPDGDYLSYSNFIKKYFCGSSSKSECSKLVAVDNKEKGGKTYSITLGNDMKIYFYNTFDRTAEDGVTFSYEQGVVPSKGRPYNDNINSIVNYITVNNHSALLTGDMMYKETLTYILDNKINQASNKLDIYKIPHHGLLNCTDQGTAVATYSETKRLFVNSNYYIATGIVDEKYDGEAYDGLDGLYRYFVEQNNHEGRVVNGCFNYLMRYGTTARVGLCNTYFAGSADTSTGAIVADFTNSSVTLSGGGKGKNTSTRCQ